jgi:hypothetical protein
MYLAHHRTMLPKSRKTHNSKVHDQDISPEQREGEKSTHESSSTNPQPTRPPMAVPYHNPRDQSCHEGEEDWRSEEANKAAAPGAFLAAEFIPRRPRQGRTGAGGRHWQLRNGINAGNGCLLGERDGSTKRKGSRRFFFLSSRRVASDDGRRERQRISFRPWRVGAGEEEDAAAPAHTSSRLWRRRPVGPRRARLTKY